VFGVVIPVGPEPRDVDRMEALVGELRRHERADEARLIVVDDAPQPRRLTLDWPSVTVLRTRVRERGRPDLFTAHTAGTLEALSAARGLEFVLKLDTDAAIVGPFSERLRTEFADPSLGVVGSYDRTSGGGTRDWSMWEARIARADRPLVLRRVDRRPRVVYRPRASRERVRALRARAIAFAPAGAHCLGGAYAVSSRFLNEAELDWRPWVASGLGEDVVTGLLASAAGLRMKSLTDGGQPFALAWQGLPASPEEIVARGHAIVHSVKRPTPNEERALRNRLQSLATSA
jgi:hypothetical protein